jgi:hypothetical protein
MTVDQNPCDMEETAQRNSDVSWTTAEVSSDEENQPLVTIKGDAKVPAEGEGDVIARYFAVAKSLRAQILRFRKNNVFQIYDFPPALVARDVNADILDDLPTLVVDMHVKSEVRDGSLFIINLNGGDGHGSGVLEMGKQVGIWCQYYFVAKIDTTLKYSDNNARSPDIVVEVKGTHRAPGGRRRRLSKLII